jgi:hypothetical protein
VIAHLIVHNDYVVGVVLDDEDKAETVKEKLAHEAYQTAKRFNPDLFPEEREYRRCNYWRLQSIEVTE